MKNIILTAIVLTLAIAGCNTNEQGKIIDTTAAADSAVGHIEIYDTAALRLIDSNAVIEVIASGFNWSEGPLWIPEKQLLLFTDVPENKIYQWKAGDSAKLYLTPSGYTGTVKRTGGEDGANGLALDNQGRLLLCQSGNRQVVRMDAPLDSPKPVFTVLSSGYRGKKFNSPNDLVADSKNNIFFTDPIYGLPQGAGDSTRELPFEGVYKIDATGKTILLIDSITNPNGIALSKDESILYVASSEDVHPKWFAYNLDANGNIKTGGVLLDGTEMKIKATVKQGADGFKLDNYGNIFSAGPDGINIISPEGSLLALIKIPIRSTSNCAFNEAKDVVYITADDLILKVRLHKN